MTNDELFSQLLDKISSFDYIHADQIPNIDLYMDQVTTFMDTHLGATRRYDEDKVLTKTMINNYAKNNLLPSPVRKKYTENHILQLILIYYMKSFLSISDIETMLKPLTQHFWDENSSPCFVSVDFPLPVPPAIPITRILLLFICLILSDYISQRLYCCCNCKLRVMNNWIFHVQLCTLLICHNQKDRSNAHTKIISNNK